MVSCGGVNKKKRAGAQTEAGNWAMEIESDSIEQRLLFSSDEFDVGLSDLNYKRWFQREE